MSWTFYFPEAVCEMSFLLVYKGFMYLDMSWNAFLLNVNHYVRPDLKTFFSILWKGNSILCILYWVVPWSHLPLSLKSQWWHLFPTLHSATSCCQLEDALGGNIYTIKSTNTIHQGCFLLFRNLVVEHLPAHHELYQLL